MKSCHNSARERSKVLQRMPNTPRTKIRSVLGRFAGVITGLFRRRKPPIKTPTSFFSVAITADIIEKRATAAEVTLQTVEAIKFEVALQRRELAARDKEMEQAKRVLEQERIAARETIRELEMERFVERQESQERYAQLLHKHSEMQQVNETQNKQLEALKQDLDQLRFSLQEVEGRAASDEMNRQMQAHENVTYPDQSDIAHTSEQAGHVKNPTYVDAPELAPTALTSLNHQEAQGKKQEANETGKLKRMDSFAKLFVRKDMRRPDE